jgi:hypothetical protein
MHSYLRAAVGILIALTWTDVAAQQNACSLLTSGDIAAATGTSAREPHSSDMVLSTGPAKGQTVHNCMWAVSDQGMVTVGMMRALTGPAREAGLATLAQAFATLRAKHWTEEKRDLTNGACSIMTPPPSEHDVPIMAGCFAEVRGMALSVGFMSPTKKLTLDQIKALLDKAIGRLP